MKEPKYIIYNYIEIKIIMEYKNHVDSMCTAVEKVVNEHMKKILCDYEEKNKQMNLFYQVHLGSLYGAWDKQEKQEQQFKKAISEGFWYSNEVRKTVTES